MSTILPGVPGPGEYAAFFAGYVAKAQPCDDPIEKLDEQLAEVLALLDPLDEKTQHHRYAPGKWSVKEMLGHVTDAERIFAYRALRIGRGDQTPLPGFDENAYVQQAQTESYSWPLLLDEFTQVRKSSVLLLERMPAAAWTRTGMVSGAVTSVRGMVYVMIGHVAHHLGILRERYL
jgi:uncharacterized damage-inducible protein DinB